MEYRIYSTDNVIPENIFNDVYSLLSDSLPQNEMRTKNGQKKLLSNNKYKLLAAFDNNSLAGFMAIWDLDEYAYIEHFAVNTQIRGKGIGSSIIKECKNLFKKPVILEVEPSGSTEIADRRIGFYQRNEFILNDYYYEQPPLQKGFAPLPLDIMSYPKPLSTDEFNNVKSTLYRYVYGIF